MAAMSTYQTSLCWQRRDGKRFTDDRYSRAHQLRFDGGAEVLASSSPQVVPLPWSDAAGVDPEEMFVASLASCHMLWFLSIAARQGYVVDRYDDEAAGVMARNGERKMVMTVVTLRPKVVFSGDKLPDAAALEALHCKAHDECFIANSVKTEVKVEPR